MSRTWTGLAVKSFFFAGLIVFVLRGPYRALEALNSYDFASVYGATRCWLAGTNPYSMRDVVDEVRSGGDDPRLFPYADPPISVYVPTAMPLVAPLATLRWVPARFLWDALSCAAFAFSLQLVFRTVSLTVDQKWALAGAVLFFSPTTTGLATGNPSALCCGMALLGLYLAWAKRPYWAALALGIAHCIKPQLSIAALAVLACWRCWRPLFASFALPLAAAAASVIRAPSLSEYGAWLATLRHNLDITFAPGGLNDPSPANPFSHNLLNLQAVFAVFSGNTMLGNLLTWTIAAALVGWYLWARRGPANPWLDLAFFSAASLTFIYHRYYDAQLLLAVVPWLVINARTLPAKAVALAMLGFLLPWSALFVNVLHTAGPHSISGFVLFRHEPVILILMCGFLAAAAAMERNRPHSDVL